MQHYGVDTRCGETRRTATWTRVCMHKLLQRCTPRDAATHARTSSHVNDRACMRDPPYRVVGGEVQPYGRKKPSRHPSVGHLSTPLFPLSFSSPSLDSRADRPLCIWESELYREENLLSVPPRFSSCRAHQVTPACPCVARVLVDCSLASAGVGGIMGEWPSKMLNRVNGRRPEQNIPEHKKQEGAQRSAGLRQLQSEHATLQWLLRLCAEEDTLHTH